MKKVSPGTIARTVCLALALINQLLTSAGRSPLPIEDDTVNLLVSTFATVAAAVVGWWKNNSFTPEAREADEIMHKLKAENHEEKQVEKAE